jgi:hypothetical protein
MKENSRFKFRKLLNDPKVINKTDLNVLKKLISGGKTVKVHVFQNQIESEHCKLFQWLGTWKATARDTPVVSYFGEWKVKFNGEMGM